jgi:hypothetical protein
MTTKREDSLIQTAAEIWQDTPEDLAFQHVVLCHLGFPRSKTDERVFMRTTGRAELLLEAGYLRIKGHLTPQPLPYGAIPRLVMIAAVTKATQQKTRTIELGHSMRESLRLLGLADTGAAHWRNVVKQSGALAALKMTLGSGTATTDQTDAMIPFRRFVAWSHEDDHDQTLWPSVMELSEDFYNAVQSQAVPLDLRAVRALGRYPMALDVYTWLAHRLCRVRGPQGDRVTWLALRQQFGQEFGEQKDFKKKMREAIKRALLVYPKARLDTWGSGITLLPSPPPVQKTQVVVSLPAHKASR